jgi:hypothetical protein
MRLFKIIGGLAVVLAFSAIAVATASAAETLWKWLPGSVGETFKGGSGKAVLSTVDEGKTLTIECTKSTLLLTDTELKVSSELLKEGATNEKDATLALLVIHFEKCKSLGLPINSTGDKAEIILVHVEAHNCIIGPGKFGILLKPLQVHLELPAAKLLILVRGDVLGLLLGAKEGEKVLTYTLDLNAKEGAQEFKKCEGGEEEKLEASLDGVIFNSATESAAEGKLEFDMTKDTAGEEMMEK